MSSSGFGVSGRINGIGTGVNLSFENAIGQSDYTVKRKGFFIPIFIPTGEGMITASIGHQKIEYFLDKRENNGVYGPIYYKNTIGSNGEVGNVTLSGDTYEVDFNSSALAVKLDRNNAVFPNYDNYRVSGQGISGAIQPTFFKNGALLGIKKDIEDDTSGNSDYEVSYQIPSNDFAFDYTPEFHFDNEYTSSLIIDKAEFNPSVSASNIFGHTTYVPPTEEARRIGGQYVEYYTNAELASNAGFNNGLLKPLSPLDYSNSGEFDPDGIGAFKVTTADGKTYHYAIPVYNHEVVSRQFGFIDDRPNENEAFFEKRQLNKYATHWLLTAVTGPDYIDMNNNQIPDEADYGYWAAMDYGKWSNAYIWYAPHGKDFEENPSDPNIKNYSWGRKDIYYLDQIKTRTHTALFVKEERFDGLGKNLAYHHRWNKNTNRTLSFLSQSQLRLKEIILLKNEDVSGINKTNVSDLNPIPNPNTQRSVTFYDSANEGGGTKSLNYSLQDNVLDVHDVVNWNNVRDKALKVIDFSGYSYELANGAPFNYNGVPGRLTLKNVSFLGKGGKQLMPSYGFEYYQGAYNVNSEDQWGFDKFNTHKWSLKEIKMPTGGKIQIDYEPDTFISATQHDLSLDATEPNNQNEITVNSPEEPFSTFGLNTGSKLPVTYQKFLGCDTDEHLPNGDPNPNPQPNYDYESYNGLATVIQIINPNQIKLKLDSAPILHEDVYTNGSPCEGISENFNFSRVDIPTEDYQTGIRVKSIKTTDGVVSYRMDYNYNVPGATLTSGIVSYVPYINQITEEVPYGMEMPPPVPMYGHVTTTSYGNNNVATGSTAYEFKVLSVKNNTNNVGFQDVLTINASTSNGFNGTTDKTIMTKSITVHDQMATLGQLISRSTYNPHGQLLSRTINNYLSPEESPQGITQESYQTYKTIDYENNTGITDRWILNSSTRIKYPSALASTTVIEGGFSSTTYFDKYDNISGQLLETRTFDSRGVEFKTEIVPAYTKYPAMGSKAIVASNKNMLTQTAMTKTFIDQGGNWEEVGVGLTTWKPYTYGSHDVWRKHKTYVWDGNTNAQGIYTSFSGSDDNFNWNSNATNEPADQDWKLVSKITMYDVYSMPLEVEDINNNRAATKQGDNGTKTLAVGNAAYEEIKYSGAEYLSGGTFNDGISGANQTSERAHTGLHSIKVTTDQGFRTTLNNPRAGKYKISVWASKENHQNARVNDGTGLKTFNGEIIEAGDWVLMNHYVDWTASSETVYVTSASGTVYFDDFRIHPVASSITSYVYNEWDELISILGSNNLATNYEYDESGRLIKTYSEVADATNVTGGFKKSSETIYQYSQPIASTIEPVFASVTYGSSGPNYQQYIATVVGGSGNYSYKWFKGIGDSSTVFETTFASTGSTYTWNNISGCDLHWIKLVVSDNEYGYLDESIRIVKNNNECDGDESGGGNQ